MARHANARGDMMREQCRGGERSELDERYAVTKRFGQVAGYLEGKAAFATPSDACERDESGFGLQHHVAHGQDVELASDQPRRLRGQMLVPPASSSLQVAHPA